MRTCVMVVVLNDPRVFAALDSLGAQSHPPDRILVVDGGSSPDYLEEVRTRAAGLPVRLDVVVVPGLPVESREGALDRIEEELTAFLDADEVAPAGWLDTLTAPLRDGRADYTGGPTRPARPPEDLIGRYHVELERKIYEQDLAHGVEYIPLGNSAWRTSLLKELRFDTRWRYAEDLDLEGRAVRKGYRGLFVPEAWVYHDKSVERSYRELFRKRYRYLVAAASVFLRDRRLGKRLGERRGRLRHPLWFVEALLKPVALVHAYLRVRSLGVRTSPPTAPEPGKR